MLKKHTISLKNAWNGVLHVLKTQPNYQVHLFLSFLAILLGWFLHISYEEFLIIIIMIIFGLTIETVNTAIEETTDAIDTAIRDDIRIAKDVSAAAMLLYAIGAVVVAAVIFLPKLI